MIPAKPDYLSTLGIDYLRRSVNKLVKEYNEYAQVEGGSIIQHIDPKILGVIFTIVSVRSGEVISALRPFINQTEKLGLFVFDQKLRENKTIYAEAPQYGLPVAVRQYSNPSHEEVVRELEIFAKQFILKSGLQEK